MGVQQATCAVCGQVKPGPSPLTRPGQPSRPFVCSGCLRDEPQIQLLRRLLRDAGWEVDDPDSSDGGASWRVGGVRMHGEPVGSGPTGGGRTRLQAVQDLYRRIMNADPPTQ
jgi:hypothetical protein